MSAYQQEVRLLLGDSLWNKQDVLDRDLRIILNADVVCWEKWWFALVRATIYGVLWAIGVASDSKILTTVALVTVIPIELWYFHFGNPVLCARRYVKQEADKRLSSTKTEELGVQWTQRTSLFVSILLSPYLVTLAYFVTISFVFIGETRLAVFFCVIIWVFGIVLPFPIYHAFLGRRELTDVHIRRRQDRPAFYLISLTAFIVALGAFVMVYQVDTEILFYSGAYVLSLAFIAGLTIQTKVSAHSAVLGAVIGCFVCLFPAWSWLPLVLTPLLVTARVARGRHTLRQCATGWTLGLIIVSGTAAAGELMGFLTLKNEWLKGFLRLFPVILIWTI